MLSLLAGRSTHPAFRIYHLAWQAADWLFPPDCAGCGKFGYRWCNACEEDIHAIDPPFCQICNQEVKKTGICGNCKSEQPAFTMLRSIGSYSGSLRNAVLKIKYKHDVGVCEIFAFKLLNLVESNKWNIDKVVAVPLNLQHLRSRGYNQAELLAKPLSWLLNTPLANDAVTRTKQTISQVGLSADHRKLNVENAFMADPAVVSGNNILLVDDIATTCSTLNECSKALKSAGAKNVFAVTLARAILSQDTAEHLKSLGYYPSSNISTLSGG